MIDVTSYIFYLIALLFTVFFAYKFERRKEKIYLILSFLFVLMFFSFRFCVGNDYADYATDFLNFQGYEHYTSRTEYGHVLLMYIFSPFYSGYIYVFAIEAFLTLFFLYKSLLKLNILSYGLFTAFSLGFVILSFDQIRQGVCISLFLYSIQYIQRQKIKKYMFCIVLGTLFHLSIIFLLPLYFIKHIKIHPILGITLIITSYLLICFNVFQHYDYIINSILSYQSLFETGNRFTERGLYEGGAGVLAQNIIGIIACLYLNRCKKANRIYFNIFIIGLVCQNVTNGIFSVNRFLNYLYYANIIVMALILVSEKRFLLKYTYIGLCFSYFTIQILLGLNSHGATPYQTLFGKNLSNPFYYQKIK